MCMLAASAPRQGEGQASESPHTAGKMLPAKPELVLQSQSAILQACLLRLLFVPAFALAGSHSASPAVVSLLTLLLGLSNGYLTCVAMMGPSFMNLEVRTGSMSAA